MSATSNSVSNTDLLLLDLALEGGDTDPFALELPILVANDKDGLAAVHTAVSNDSSADAVDRLDEHSRANTDAMLLASIDTTLDLLDLDLFGLDEATTAVANGAAASGTVTAAPANSYDQQAKQRRKSAHQRTKDELQYLRTHVHELEQRLEGLRCASASSMPIDANDTDACPLPPSQSQSQQLWERIAQRQLDAKQRAEVENLKLRQALESQLRVAKSLSNILRKRPNLPWLDASLSGTGTKRLRADPSCSDERVFELLATRVDTLLVQLDDVMCNAGLAGVTTAVQDGVVTCDDFGCVVLEAIDCHVVPFDESVVSTALWQLLSGPPLVFKSGVYKTVDSVDDDIVRAQFTVTLQLRRSEAPIHVQLVAKRVVDAACMRYVWASEATSEGTLVGSGRFAISSRGYGLVEPAAEPATTVMKSVVHMRPTVTQTGALTDVMLSSFQENYAIMHQHVEDLILRDMRSAAAT